MSEPRDEHIKTLTDQRTAQRREINRDEARRRGRRLQAEQEKSFPADLPLHKRGFGVLNESGA
jgi:hypothetical protein